MRRGKAIPCLQEIASFVTAVVCHQWCVPTADFILRVRQAMRRRSTPLKDASSPTLRISVIIYLCNYTSLSKRPIAVKPARGHATSRRLGLSD